VGFNKKQWFGSGSYNRNFFNGWNEGDPVFGEPENIADSTRVKLWKPRTQNQGSLQVGRKLKKGSIIYNLRAFDEIIINRGAPGGPYNERAFDDNYLTKRLDNSLNMTFVVDSVNSLQILGSHNYYQRIKEAFVTDLTGVTYTPNPEQTDTNTAEQLMMRATYGGNPTGKNWQYQVGIDLNHETIGGERILDGKQAIGDYAGFASLEYGLGEKWIIRPGLRASYNTKYGAPVIPSLYAKYNLHPGMAIRASVARGFRAPSVKELYMDFVDINHNIVGNPNLQAETALHASTNFSYTRIHKNTMIKFKFGLFYNHINDKITLAQINDVEYVYQNVDEALSLGGNTEVQYGIGHLKTTIGFSYTGNQNKTYESSEPSELVFSPQVTGNVTYAFKESGVDLALFLKHSGRVPQFVIDENQQLIEQYIDQYTLLDFTAKKKLWASRVSVSAGVKNILNVTNVATGNSNTTHGSTAGFRPIAPGRVYFLKLGLRL
jgi:outer membrane receptor for ferrienterochelin and colicins